MVIFHVSILSWDKKYVFVEMLYMGIVAYYISQITKKNSWSIDGQNKAEKTASNQTNKQKETISIY